MSARSSFLHISIKGPPGSRCFVARHRDGRTVVGSGYPTSVAAIRAATRQPQPVPQQQKHEHSSARQRHPKADGGTESECSPGTEHPRPQAEAGDGLGGVVVESGLGRGRRVHAPGPAPHCKAEDPADTARTDRAARDPAAGEGPRGDHVRDRQRPDIAERVGGPHLLVGTTLHPVVSTLLRSMVFRREVVSADRELLAAESELAAAKRELAKLGPERITEVLGWEGVAACAESKISALRPQPPPDPGLELARELWASLWSRGCE